MKLLTSPPLYYYSSMTLVPRFPLLVGIADCLEERFSPGGRTLVYDYEGDDEISTAETPRRQLDEGNLNTSDGIAHKIAQIDPEHLRFINAATIKPPLRNPPNIWLSRPSPYNSSPDRL